MKSRITFLQLTLIVSLLALPDVAAASPYWLDPTFGDRGKVFLTWGEPRESASATAIQQDGKILITGRTFTGSYDTFVARYHPDGSLDTSFNGSGKLRVNVPGLAESPSDIITLPDGKILISGNANSHLFYLMRLNADGSLDTTFDGDGAVTTGFLDPFGLQISYAIAKSVVLLADGKILAAGGNGYIIMSRYNSDGSLDSSFDGDGRVVQALPGGSTTTRMMVQPDGKIITIGFSNATPAQYVVARFNSNGSPDPSFGNGGAVISSVGFEYARPWACALQLDGKIVAVGAAANKFLVVRFNPSGSLDSTFDDDGVIATTFNGSSTEAHSVLIYPDGRILVGGYTVVEIYGRDVALARYKVDGSPDTSFGIGGKLTTNVGNGFVHVADIELQQDGKIIAGGTVDRDPTQSVDEDMMILRYSVEPRSSLFDFDRDGRTDLSIFRPIGTSGSEWWWLRSSNGSNGAVQFGDTTDKIVPADYTGDGKTDVAFWRPETGNWFVLRSEDFSFYAFPFGATGDVPVPADYDGDGKADAAVFRESAVTWYINRSSGGTDIFGFGSAGDKTAVADYDGDGKADVAIFRPAGVNGAEWWVRRSSDAVVAALQFGSSTDKAVPGDFTGDGKADVAFWRPSTGFWNVLRSEDFSYYAFPFGANGDIASPGDYDGDGKLDAAVFRPSSATWFANRSTAGTLIQQFGQTGDVPVPNAFVR